MNTTNRYGNSHMAGMENHEPVHDTTDVEDQTYEINPSHSLGTKSIYEGFDTLIREVIDSKIICIDGYVGVDWTFIRNELAANFNKEGVAVHFYETSEALKSEADINKIVEPFLGAGDSVWGTRTDLELADFFDGDKIGSFESDLEKGDVVVVLGPFAAAYMRPDARLIYVDLPKNELQYRMRSKEIVNLGATQPLDTQSMYKRFYFVDWVVLNQHKQRILKDIDIIIDGQYAHKITWAKTEDILHALETLSQSVFRVKPWFEPGAWGGQWLKQHIKDIDQEVINYAWSFELIVPENGLVFESDGNHLELSFDFLMFAQAGAILGKHVTQHGTDFPIRFDFLDTFDGGNLSIQCHPSLKYIQENFGERITQDETYYILDAGDDASVYIGFQEDIEPEAFRLALEESQASGQTVEIEKYVQKLPSKKHDLFLIPNGTVHSAAKNNLVLEISATPYIFTFKMYDWMRMDLNGAPRPINIDHAFNNLNFERKGDRVIKELKSKPYLLKSGDDWQLFHFPTHAEHFYDVHQIVISSTYQESTENVCHVLMLVEGERLKVRTASGIEKIYHYAETFVVPAAAAHYELVNLGIGSIKVVKAFLK